MKVLHSSRVVDIPEGITLEVKGRQVRVKGPRGEQRPAGIVLSKSFAQACL